MSEQWRASSSLAALQCRADLYRMIREFFHQRGVLEVETPIISEAGNTDPNIQSFTLQFNGNSQAGNKQRWLRTSPEFPLKRLLACGIGDCYELGKVFRDGEFGRKHNPEFSMLEWYRVGWTHQQLMAECAEFVMAVFSSRNVSLDLKQFSYRQLFLEFASIDPFIAKDQELQTAVSACTEMAIEGLSRDDLLDVLMTHIIEPKLPANQLSIVFDFPASQCALAKIRFDSTPVAERFELYLGGVELANGYHELIDSIEHKRRFKNDLGIRTERQMPLPAVDQHLLMALPCMPECAGVAMGVDRLLMVLQNFQSISDVIAFDFSRA